MSLSGQSTTQTSHSNLQSSIIDALANYANQTGIDLSQNPFAERLQQSTTSDAILELLQEREKAFEEYRNGDRRLINCLSPAVRVLHGFSGLLSEAIGIVPFPPVSAIFVGINVLLTAASGVSSSYDALLELFECLGSFLKRLGIYTDIPPTPIMTDIIVKILLELLSVLSLATKQIKKGRLKKFTKKLLGESEVEAVLQRLDRLTRDEARITVAQTLNVVHGLVNNTRVVMEDGKTSTDSIRQALVALQELVDNTNKTKREQFRKDVLDWLSPPDPSTNLHIARKGHHKGTAGWFLQSSALRQWKSAGSLLWIHGKPGSGKSTLLSEIILNIEGLRTAGLATMAYYYFDFHDAKKQDRYGLLSSLLSQLSAKSDSCYKVLSKLYSDNASSTGKPDNGTLTECIQDMLSFPGQGPIYIIIDALDECSDTYGTPSAQEEVLGLIDELVNLILRNVSLCVASRPEIDIRNVIEPLKPLQISLHDEDGQKNDIIEYIKSVIYSDRKMQNWREEDKQLVIDILSSKADGMFRWVVCQIDRLRRSFPASIRGVLNGLPKSLDETYARTLLGIHEEKREYTQRLFQCLTVSIRPLNVDELAEIFAFHFDDPAAPTFNPDWRLVDAGDAVLSACSSLVSIVDDAGSQIVQFSHFSVKEFLTSERLANSKGPLSCYHILPELAHATLARVSLSILLRLDEKTGRNAIRHCHLTPYAARYWIDHAQFGNVTSQVQDMMECLFDPMKSHFSAWTRLYDVDDHGSNPMSDTHPTQPSAPPLYYASLCGFRGLVEHLFVSHPQEINARGGCYGTPLCAASAKGHFEIVELLLDSNADPNSHDDDRWTPLHAAALHGHLEVSRLLLERGVDANVRKGDGWSPLHLVSANGYSDIAKLLIRHDADVNSRNDKRETPLDRASANGHLEVVRLLIAQGANIHAKDNKGWNPLHLASQNGHLDIVRLLVQNRTAIDIQNGTEKTPLALAASKGNVEVARFLIDQGADKNARDDQSWAPLHFASRLGHVDMVQLLLESGVDPNINKDDRWSSLHLASANGHLGVVQLLVQRGATVDLPNEKQQTALDRAASNGKIEVVRFLIEHKANVHATDSSGCTPLHAASQNGYLNVVRLLLRRGADVHAVNTAKETPEKLALESDKAEVARFLAEYKIDPNGRINLRSAALDTADRVSDEDGKDDEKGLLHSASEEGKVDVVKSLLDRGADVNSLNTFHKTPLDIAATKGNLDVVRLLLNRGAEVDSRDRFGWTPLHKASRYGHVEVTRVLIKHGANMNARKQDHWTPIHLSARNGHLGIVQLLLDHGADPSLVNDEGRTPLQLSLGKRHREIAGVLQEKNGA